MDSLPPLKQLLLSSARNIWSFLKEKKNRLYLILFIVVTVLLVAQGIIRTLRYASDFNMFLDPAIDARFFDKSPFESWKGNSYNAFFYGVMSLLSPFSKWFASLIWSVLNILLFIGSCSILNKLLPPLNNKKQYLIAPLLLLLVFADNIQLGQSNIIVLFTCLAAMYSLYRNKNIHAGFFMGFSIAYKVIPAVFVFYFLLRKKFKATLYSVAFSLFMVAVVPMLFYSPAKNLTYLNSWTEMVIAPFLKGDDLKTENTGYYHTNQSLEAFANRNFTSYGIEEYGGVFNYIGFEFEEETVSTVVNFIRIAIILLLAILVLRAREIKAITFIRNFSLFFISILIISPAVWPSYYIFLLPAYVILVQSVFSMPMSQRKTLMVTLLGLATLFMISGVSIVMQSLSAYLFGAFFLFTALLFIPINNDDRVSVNIE